MATVGTHQEQSTGVEVLLGQKVSYQKHKPGANLSVERLDREEVIQIDSVNRFGNRIVVNDGAIVMEDVPAVMMRGGRVAFLLPTGEELYLTME